MFSLEGDAKMAYHFMTQVRRWEMNEIVVPAFYFMASAASAGMVWQR
jgi:hypothetical protein